MSSTAFTLPGGVSFALPHLGVVIAQPLIFFFKSGNFEGTISQDFFGNIQSPFRLINNKVITPSSEEVEVNPRSRSAKLRIAEKL